MNDGTIIIEKILADANKEAEIIITKAKNEAEDIAKKNEKAIKELIQKAEITINEEMEKICSKEVSAAKMEAGKMILSKKQQLIDEVMNASYKKLMSLDENDYFNILLDMLKDAPKGEIILSDKDKNSAGRLIAEKGYIVSDETRPIDRGFVVKNGDIEHNFSFASVLAIKKEEIRLTIAEMLFK